MELTPQRVYWFAAACVDVSGQFDPTNVTIFGPVTTAGGLNDGIAPSMILGTTAEDVPDDEGGRIEVTWSINERGTALSTRFTPFRHRAGNLQVQ